jgi:hypothetical protein
MARPLPAKAENFFTAVYRIQKATFPVPQIPRGLLTTPAEKLPDLFGQVSLVNLPLFPLVHGLLIACDLRRATAVGFARDPLKRNVQSPVQSLLASIFASNGGSFLVGEPFLLFFLGNRAGSFLTSTSFPSVRVCRATLSAA